ncbi:MULTISPECIES: TRAFAC clade GTPase domain-containing protein [Catenuloplanes]|uniref:Double-GTPase 2 domain-containing protein n=1 Tax=Catenuloplanes niger TaxID=587534 RepID=A0AAE4CZ63_9ACTN|nr:hypothetical protein [Catenuloplanes niger]MDR7328288.1 hypothetical protein [Catenuloplanes niger]
MYIPVTPRGPDWQRIGTSFAAVPFVLIGCTLFEAVVAIRAYAIGMAAGLGIGRTAEPLAPRLSTEQPAYVQYLFGPVWRDVLHTIKIATQRQAKAAEAEQKRIRRKHFPGQDDELVDSRNRIVGFTMLVSIVTGFLLAAVLLSVVLAIQALVIGILWAVGIVVIYSLRLIDSALLIVRGIRITCTHCYHRVPYPGYYCDGCGNQHRDIRPGRYGMLHRTCKCGHRMPTLLMLGSYRMRAFCPHCGQDLPSHVGRSAEIVVPVLGASGAGKTQFLAAVSIALDEKFSRTDGSMRPADAHSEAWYRQVGDIRARGTTVTKTPPGPQRGVSLWLERGRRSARVVLFDAAGELFGRGDGIRDLLYLRAKPAYVFIVDPLSVPTLWASLSAGDRARLEPVRAAESPETVFEHTIDALHEMRVRTRNTRMAVVVSKADLIAPQLTAAQVGDSDSIRTWLDGPLEQGNLVRSIDLNSASARFFLVDARLAGHPSAGVNTFVDWLLDGWEVRP